MAVALRWQVLIDWPNTGVWTAANADVSADVMALRWQWGRRGLPVPEFAPPAELELTLRNHGHRYTPGFTAGPWPPTCSLGGPFGCAPAGFTTTSPRSRARPRTWTDAPRR